MTYAVGYAGMALLLMSYLLPSRRLLYAQAGASALLFTYSVLQSDAVFIAVQAACLILLTIRLMRGAHEH